NIKVACSSMYNGARTSFTSLSSSAISAISAMCSSVVSQVSSMSSQVISYWNSVRATVSAPISASFNVKTTQTTVKRTVNESSGGILGNILDRFADGGVATRTSICGEDGAEMVIPLSNARRSRAMGLYEQTGKMLGLSSTPSQKIGGSYSNIVNNVRQFPLTNALDTDNKEYKEATPNNINSSNNTINLGGISINIQESNNKEDMIQEILSQVESEIREALQDIG
ncbi:TPA: phage tail tape measure protein, partial [Clostridioides difficile]|nr:phage tail tape measure protein [Clostridioides difficile]